MERILIVEDEPKIAGLLQKYLHNAGYQTDWLADGAAVGESMRHQEPSLILLDLMLPGKDGLEVCKDVRQFSQAPIIMLTARVEEIDRLLGLELGADDYICKPFSPREVVARVKTLLRRVHRLSSPPGASVGTDTGLSLDRDRLVVSAGRNEASLTRVEFELLSALHQQPGRIFSRDQLMGKAYWDNRIVSDRTIDSHIKKLRKKLAAIAPQREFVHSVYSVGYKFEI